MNFFQQAKYQEAAYSFERGRSLSPSSLRINFYLATSYLLLGQTESALALAQQVHLKDPRSALTSRLLGEVLTRKSSYSEAKTVLEAALRDSPDNAAILRMLGNIALQEDRAADGVSYFQQVVALEPDSQQAQDLLRVAKLMNGQALSEDTSGNYEQEFIMALEQFKKGNFDQALAQARHLHEQNLDKIDPLNLLAACYLKLGDWHKAKAEFERVLVIEPNEPSAARNLAKIEATVGKTGRARELLKALIKSHPGDIKAVISLVQIETELGNEGQGIQLLAPAVRTNPNEVSLRQILVKKYFQTSRFAALLELTQNLTSEQVKSQPALLELRGRTQLLSGDVSAARQSIERLVAEVPGSALGHVLLSDILARSGDLARAKNEIKQAIEQDPNLLSARVGEVKILAQSGAHEEAKQALGEFERDFGENTAVLNIAGWLAIARGEYAMASEKFAAAAKQNPTTEFTLLWSGALWEKQRHEEAIEVMNSWLVENPKDVVVQYTLANAYLQQNRTEEAKELYSKVVELQPKHVAALNNLAWLMRDSDLDQAVSFAEQAYGLEADNSDVLDTLGMLLLKQGEVQRGTRFIRKALSHAPENAAIQYHLGVALVKDGARREALEVLTSLINKAPDTRIAGKAQKLLDSISQ